MSCLQLSVGAAIGLCGTLISSAVVARPLVPQLTVDELIARSDAIVVGTITQVDPSLSREPEVALTGVTVSVDEILGKSERPESVELVFRGGVLPDGSVSHWSSAPRLKVGTRYMFFLRSEYYVSPLVAATEALIEGFDVDGKLRAKNRLEQGVLASDALGLVPTYFIKTVPQDGASAESSGIEGGPDGARSVGASAARGAPAEAQRLPVARRPVELSSTFESVVAVVRQRFERSGKQPEEISILLPLSLPSGGQPTTLVLGADSDSDADSMCVEPNACEGEETP